MDYAHPLRFGVELDGGSLGPERAAKLARGAGRLGLDVVAVGANPDGFDPWTVLTWVAAVTDRVTLLATAAPLPPVPAVLARAAASLDLLADGRLELVLVDGIATDADQGASPAERLAEGVEILRGVWSATPDPLRLDGEHFTVPAASRGPAPASNVAVWLSTGLARDADREDVLRLAGTTADGWHGAPSEIVGTNASIDAAARESGRDPREVRRSVSMPVSAGDGWVAEVAELASEHGVSTFLVRTDDDGVLETFAKDVVPAVRARVERARRATGVVVGVPLPARLARLRRPGIDYAAVPAAVSSIEPWHARFANVRSNYLRGGNPGLVLLPRDVDELAETIRFARSQDVPLGVRSGGHGVSGRSTNDGGIVIDLSRLAEVEVVDPASRLVRIGAGARWSDVAQTLAPFDLAVTSGDSGGVGVGGLATAGGIGWYARKHGLTIDRVRAVEVVLADGTAVRTSASEHPELFWGMRGAGGNLAVATSFEIEAHPGGPLGFAQLVFDASDVAAFLEGWGATVEAAARDVTSFLLIARPRPGQPVVAQVMAAVDSPDPDTVLEHLQPFARLAPLLDQSVRIAPYRSIIVPPSGPHRGEGEPVTRSSLVEHISRDVARAAERVVVGGASYFFQTRAVGGAVSDVAPDATAYAHRGARFSLIAFGASRARLDPVWDELHQHAEGLYLSFETDPRPERLTDAFPPLTLQRLRDLKRRYDPDRVLTDNFVVAP